MVKSNNGSWSDILVTALKLGCLAIGVTGLTIAQANANNISLNEAQMNIIPHQTTLWSDLD